jgi:rSAM/selenodomain-associated transferase 2
VIKGLSVIVPCWNDAASLRSLFRTLSRLNGVDEVIVADASDGDECRQLAKDSGACTVQCAQPGRGSQLNAGARCATGEVLLFQHADTELRQEHIDSLRVAMGGARQMVGGAFYRRFDGRHARLRWLEPWARLLAEHGGTFYGDQSIFVRRSVFEQLRGFAEIPLMEDVEFSKRLRKAGPVTVLDPPIASSPRAHEQHGAWRTSIRNAAIILLYRAGVAPERLHAWYYADRQVAVNGARGPATQCVESR